MNCSEGLDLMSHYKGRHLCKGEEGKREIETKENFDLHRLIVLGMTSVEEGGRGRRKVGWCD